MENMNENLTPEELIEKLVEMLQEFESVDEETEQELFEAENILEEEAQAEAEEQIDEFEGDVVSETEVEEYFDIAPTEVVSAVNAADDESFEESTDEIDPRIMEMLEQLDVDDTDIPESLPMDESVDSTVAFTAPGSSQEVEDLSATTVFDSGDVDATTVFESPKSEAVEDTVLKPKVYRFRRCSDELDATKVQDAVSVSNETEADFEKTKLNDVLGFQKPDLVVMQTFGATVEHVRSLYGDSVADEYEKMISNSDFTEREAAEYEYTSSTQKNEIFHEFKAKRQKSKLKILACAVLCALMLLLENLSLFNIQLGGILDSTAYPVSYIMIDLQLLVLCGVFAFSVLKNGVSNIFMLEPTSYSVSAVIFIFAVIINIASCFVGGSVILYNFAAGIALLFSMIYEDVKIKRDYMAFRILSSDKVKNAAIVGVGTSKDEEVSVYEVLEDDEEVKIINLQKGKFVKSFFARTKQTVSSSQDKLILPLAAAGMIVMFVISLVVGKDVSIALKVANMSFCAFLPFAVYFSLSYPTNKAAKSVYESGAAIVGNAALEEYSGSSIIAFEDRDVFPSYCVKLKSVKIYGNASIDKVLYNTASVFSKVGGPLCDVFSLSTVEIGSSADVELVRVADDGLEALVDGHRILAGLPSFMSEYGIHVRVDESDSDDMARLYVADRDELCAKFYIKYNLDVDFENVITRMTSCGICAVLKTYDPNINNKMLSTLIDTAKYPVKVIRGKIGDDFIEIHDELDSGIISTSGSKHTVDAIVTCERLYNIRSSANNVKIVSAIIGMILSAFIAFFGITPFSSLIVVLYQLLWMIPALVSGKLYL